MPKLISGWTTCCFLLAAMSVSFCIDIDSFSSPSSSSSTEVINDEAMTPILEEQQHWNYPSALIQQEDNGQRISNPLGNDLRMNEDGDGGRDDDDDNNGNDEEQDDYENINRNRNNNNKMIIKNKHHQQAANKELERVQQHNNNQFDWKVLKERKRSSPPSHLFAASSFGMAVGSGGPSRRRISLNEKQQQQQQSKYLNQKHNQHVNIADPRNIIAVGAAPPTPMLSDGDTMDSSIEVEPSVLPLLGFHSAAVQFNYNRPNDAIIKKILRQAARRQSSMKRSPNCMRKCIQQGLLHPAQCHSLC